MEHRDPDRIPEMLQLLQAVWQKQPDMRLGQLLLNSLDPVSSCPELYYIEDDRLLQRLGIKNPPPVRPLSDQPVVNLSEVRSESDIHEAFASEFKFPEFYGANWDAFWDVLTGFGCFPNRFTIIGTENLRERLPESLTQLDRIFADCQNEMKGDAPIVTWR